MRSGVAQPTLRGRAEDARSVLAKSQPDGVLLDVNLPDGDGRRFADELRETHPDRGATGPT